jgi:NADH:ubiquinone oxidoreductase subunit F (NADH-binding)
VQNVETLAQLALLARHGPEWFRGLGTSDEPGTRLLTLSGAVRSAGVYEVAGGAALGSVLELAGGASMPVQALLVGGYHGGWVPWNAATADLPHSRAALTPYGADPGAGVVVALGSDRCGLRAGADIAAYLAGQSAGQCGPCVNGLPAVADHLARLAAGRTAPSAVRELRRVVGLVEGRGACHHPDGTARLVRSTLLTFAAEVELHVAGRCSAAVSTFGSGRR